jgi:hypothetical protein
VSRTVRRLRAKSVRRFLHPDKFTNPAGAGSSSGDYLFFYRMENLAPVRGERRPHVPGGRGEPADLPASIAQRRLLRSQRSPISIEYRAACQIVSRYFSFGYHQNRFDVSVTMGEHMVPPTM